MNSFKKVIVGLGNKGVKYSKTRHNAGFMVVDQLAVELDLSFVAKKYYKLAKGMYEDTEVILLKPETYMNLSGIAVQIFLKKENINIKDILVVYDDIYIELGKIRFKKKGSHAGHNGIKSIIECLQTDVFRRLKVGIGGGNDRDSDLVRYVLGKFEYCDLDKLEEVIQISVKAEIDFLKNDFDVIMTKYNK
jgi:peptidyl-tRNA hydrolase, PTH1 family